MSVFVRLASTFLEFTGVRVGTSGTPKVLAYAVDRKVTIECVFFRSPKKLRGRSVGVSGGTRLQLMGSSGR